MIIDDQFLVDIGIIVNSDDEKKKVVQDIFSIFVGELADNVFEEIDDNQALALSTMPEDKQIEWIKQNVPNYQQIGDRVLAEIKEELTRNHLEILGV